LAHRLRGYVHVSGRKRDGGGRAVLKGHTIDGIEDMAVGGTGSALFDLGVVDLEELVEPCKKFGP